MSSNRHPYEDDLEAEEEENELVAEDEDEEDEEDEEDKEDDEDDEDDENELDELDEDEGKKCNSVDTDNENCFTRNDEDKNNRWIFTLSNAERVDFTYGPWIEYCFDREDNYTRKDLNMPLTLGKREGGQESYRHDTPLTRVGQLQAQLVGEGLRLAGVSVAHVYASAALRCVETAQSLLEGLQADPSVKIRVEPGLFEHKPLHVSKESAPFMTPFELDSAGYDVDLEYKPYLDQVDIAPDETLDEYYERNEMVIHGALSDTENEGGNIIFVAHGDTLKVMAVALRRLQTENEDATGYKLNPSLLGIPNCSLAAARGNPPRLVAPPCPPGSNSSSGRFDWNKILDE